MSRWMRLMPPPVQLSHSMPEKNRGRTARPQPIRRGHGLLDPIQPHFIAVAGLAVQAHQVQHPQEQVRLVGQGRRRAGRGNATCRGHP